MFVIYNFVFVNLCNTYMMYFKSQMETEWMFIHFQKAIFKHIIAIMYKYYKDWIFDRKP